MARLTPILVLVMCVGLWGCLEAGCPYGSTKVHGTCLHDDAGVDAAEGSSNPSTLEAGVDPATGRDAALDATSIIEAGPGADGGAPGASSASDAAAAISDAALVMDGMAPGIANDAAVAPEASTAADASSAAPVSCSPGHVLKNGACQDIDECFEGTHQCHMTSTCKNTVGSYDCECPLGYSGGTSAGFACAPRIAAGSDHACVLLLDGTVQCWGKNASGQLGDGTQTPRTVPATVNGLANVALVSSGSENSCAVLRDGSVRCWGRNDTGQLGDGTLMNRPRPVEVQKVESAIALSSAGNHACIVMRNGTVKCWGANTHGQLGTGATASAPSLIAVGTVGVSTASNVFVHGNQTCLIARDGSARCWGNGFLGNEDGNQATSLTPVTLDVPRDIKSIVPGPFHACSVHTNGQMYCWGPHALGGNGGSAGGPAYGGPQYVENTTATGLAIGVYRTWITRPDSTMWWWDAGSKPAPQEGVPSCVAVSSFLFWTCGVLTDGRVTCFDGSNQSSTGFTIVAGIDLW